MPLRQRLSIRIASLILLTGPAVLIAVLLFNAAFYGTLGQPAPWWSRLIQVGFIALGTPIILGLLAARYVTKPLDEFTRVITTMKENDYHVRLHASGIHEFDRVFGEFNELTERLSEEEVLRKNLISDTAHELNTPLTAVIGQLEAMKAGVLKKDTEHIDTLLNEAQRLNSTTERLVEYAKLQSHMLQADCINVDLEQLIKELIRENEQGLKQAGIVMTTQLTDPTILANRMLLKQLLANLIQNAIRYSGGNAITISHDGKVLTIADNGHGVPEKDLRYLFERFYRVDPSRSRASGGLGLGLAIVKEITLCHGWHISVKNAKPGLRFEINQNFISNSRPAALLHSMKTLPIHKSRHISSFREVSPWAAIALIAFGLILFTHVAVQQVYRMSANDPQTQIAEDAASAWNAGTTPTAIVSSTKVNMATSLSPFTIIIGKGDDVLASSGQLNGTTPLPPNGVFSDASTKGEQQFTWQTEDGLRFAAVVVPTSHGTVLTARSLKEVEQREQDLTLMAGLTALGVIGVLVLAYFVIAR